MNRNNDNNAHTQLTQQYFTNSIDNLTTMKIDERERATQKHEKSTKTHTSEKRERKREYKRREEKPSDKKKEEKNVYSIKAGAKVNLGMNRAIVDAKIRILIFDAASACITSSRLSNMRRYVR